MLPKLSLVSQGKLSISGILSSSVVVQFETFSLVWPQITEKQWVALRRTPCIWIVSRRWFLTHDNVEIISINAYLTLLRQVRDL